MSVAGMRRPPLGVFGAASVSRVTTAGFGDLPLAEILLRPQVDL